MAKERLITNARSTAVPTAPATSRVRSLLTFIFRLLLLGVSVSGAWLVGITLAHYYPAQSQATPLQEIVLRRSGRFIQRIQRLIELWNQSSLSPQNLEPRFLPAESAPPPSQTVVNPQPSLSLTAAEQQQMEQALATLETELQGLSYRMTDLETQLGQLPSNSPLESRLQSLNQQLSTQTASTATGNSANSATAPALDPSSSALSSNSADPTMTPSTGSISSTVAPLSQGHVFKVTLPSDRLFEDDQGRLTTEASSILNSIIPDLAKYPGAAVLIGSHTDNQSTVNTSREVSFQQAIAIQQRLAQTLGHSYHLVPIGYGQAQPIVSNDTAANRQRNRRIEITLTLR